MPAHKTEAEIEEVTARVQSRWRALNAAAAAQLQVVVAVLGRVLVQGAVPHAGVQLVRGAGARG